jgi:hypothetical protein
VGGTPTRTIATGVIARISWTGENSSIGIRVMRPQISLITPLAIDRTSDCRPASLIAQVAMDETPEVVVAPQSSRA